MQGERKHAPLRLNQLVLNLFWVQSPVREEVAEDEKLFAFFMKNNFFCIFTNIKFSRKMALCFLMACKILRTKENC